MNINFHYFAVKTIASAAGFTEQQAQTIAFYSQFVDDFNLHKPVPLADVPEFAQHLAEKTADGRLWKFYPVTTGFDGVLDFVKLVIESNQRLVTIPFHFITEKSLDQYQSSKQPFISKILDWLISIFSKNQSGEVETTTPRHEYRTKPVKPGDSSLLSKMLKGACMKYRKQENEKNLMRIGMLLHTFADSYAHQNFSGFGGWENRVDLISAACPSEDNADLTGEYEIDIVDYLKGLIPVSKYDRYDSFLDGFYVGHAGVIHAPDDSYVKFGIRMKSSESSGYNMPYGRTNAEEFTKAARVIYNYLTRCAGAKPMPDTDWENFAARLGEGFALKHKDVNNLCDKWKNIFPEFEYRYNKNELLASAFEVSTNSLGKPDKELINDALYADSPKTNRDESVFTVTEEAFFHYNVIAKEIRDRVNGKVTPIKTVYEKIMEHFPA